MTLFGDVIQEEREIPPLMSRNYIIVRNCIEAKRREANSYQNPGCYNAAFCRGYVEGASETLSTMLSPAENSTEAFIILSHYSNENIGEFNAVGLHGLYSSFDSAKKAADAMLKEDEENGCHGEAIPYTTDDCCDNGIFDDYPLYVAGVQEKDNFNAFHNFYAIFSCNLVP